MKSSEREAICRAVRPAAIGLLTLICWGSVAHASDSGVTKDRWFIFSGKKPDGTYVEKCLLVNEVLRDDYGPGTTKRDMLIEAEDGQSFRKMGTYPPSRWERKRKPTRKYDCAGLVFDELWDKDKKPDEPGKYAFKIGADRFYKTIIKEFGTEVGKFDYINKSDVVV